MPDQPGSLAADMAALLKVWRAWLADHPESGEFGRSGGYRAGLRVCADQLDEALRRTRDA